MARVSKSVQEIREYLKGNTDALASFVTDRYVTWRNNSAEWRSDMKELRNYIFQTDTTQTANKKLPWKNKTSIPKICQIRDNLHANYLAALFPHDDWFKWEAESDEAADRDKARSIEAYIRQKVRESGFKQTVSDILYDYIDYGNCFGEVVYEQEKHTTPDGLSYSSYVGPRTLRISPFDLQFDLSASSFKDAAKVTRSLISIGALEYAGANSPGYEWAATASTKTRGFREAMALYGDSDLDKAEGFVMDGFGSLREYLSSGMVEVLEFEGDTYEQETGKIQTNRHVIVVDRRFVVLDKPINTWLGRSNKEHVSWRLRPSNLMGMGPLDNLVGMQYRLDHLENLRADVFDQIAHPVVVVYGQVEDFEWGPDERIYADLDSKVDILRPDATALNADFQMDRLMQQMEEMAGAPRQAMGIRTPGEKTAFEIQSLDNAAGRIFQQKITNFEERFVEPLLNQMLESARKNVNGVEIVKTLDEDFGIEEFLSIDTDTLNSKGKLRPIGARHFARQAQTVQNVLGFVNSAAYQDPAVTAHISGLKIAEIFEESLNLGRYDLVQQNIRIAEQMQTQQMATAAQSEVAGGVAQRQMAANEQIDAEEAETREEVL